MSPPTAVIPLAIHSLVRNGNDDIPTENRKVWGLNKSGFTWKMIRNHGVSVVISRNFQINPVSISVFKGTANRPL